VPSALACVALAKAESVSLKVAREALKSKLLPQVFAPGLLP
jgi:hypothetical protein